jgi:serine/threonine protein kinase
VHERGLVHKDIKPANILVDPASGGVWLTGFGIASRLPRERQAPAPPEVIAGTLAYMGPEQTGAGHHWNVEAIRHLAIAYSCRRKNNRSRSLGQYLKIRIDPRKSAYVAVVKNSC